jgi:hypothetical protein
VRAYVITVREEGTSMTTRTFGPTPDRLNRQPIRFAIKERDGETDRMVSWQPQKVSAMLLDSGAFSDASDADPGNQIRESMRPVRAQMDWFAGGLSDEDETWILERLRDPEDWFDFADLTEITKFLIGLVSGRPTGTPPA